MTKLLPNKAPNWSTMNKLKSDVWHSLNSLGVVPDVILGHWLLPSLEMVAFLKEKYLPRNRNHSSRRPKKVQSVLRNDSFPRSL